MDAVIVGTIQSHFHSINRQFSIALSGTKHIPYVVQRNIVLDITTISLSQATVPVTLLCGSKHLTSNSWLLHMEFNKNATGWLAFKILKLGSRSNLHGLHSWL